MADSPYREGMNQNAIDLARDFVSDPQRELAEEACPDGIDPTLWAQADGIQRQSLKFSVAEAIALRDGVRSHFMSPSERKEYNRRRFQEQRAAERAQEARAASTASQRQAALDARQAELDKEQASIWELQAEPVFPNDAESELDIYRNPLFPEPMFGAEGQLMYSNEDEGDEG